MCLNSFFKHMSEWESKVKDVEGKKFCDDLTEYDRDITRILHTESF